LSILEILKGSWGSSAFGIVVTQFADGIVQILHAEEYHRPDYNEMLSIVYTLMSKYDIDKIYIDGANPSFIKSLKLQISEDPDYFNPYYFTEKSTHIILQYPM
jgi:hypothetical protein